MRRAYGVLANRYRIAESPAALVAAAIIERMLIRAIA